MFAGSGLGGFGAGEPGNHSANCQDRAHDGERDGDGHFKPVRGQHLASDKGKQGAKAVMQIAQAIEQRGKCEVERAEAENRGDVRGVDDEWIVRDRQYRGNGIHGKQEISELDCKDYRKQRTLRWLQFANPLWNGCVRGIAADEPECSVEQKKTKDPCDPVEALDQCDPGGDEEGAQDDCARDSPEQSGVLPLFADLESAEEDEEDEEVVDAERGFDRIAGDEFKRFLMALPESDPDGKDHGGREQDRGPYPRGCLGAGLIFAMRRQEGVHEQQREDCQVKTNPPSPGRAGNHSMNATGQWSVFSCQCRVNSGQ